MSILEIEREIETKLNNSLPEILFSLFQELETVQNRQAGLDSCPKCTARSYYTSAKLKLHRLKKLVSRWDEEYFNVNNYLPIATSMQDLLRKIYDLRSEYYGTRCKCGQCNPAHTGESLERARNQAKATKRYAGLYS